MKRDSERLLIVTTILICIGIVMIYSSSSCYGYERFNDGAFYLKRHLLYLIIGTILSAIFMKIDYRKIRQYSKILVIVSVVSLLFVFVPGIGYSAGGARRWIKIGTVGFQPSEFARLFVIIYLADALERKQDRIKDFFYSFIPTILVSGIVVLLILLQPDLGSAGALLVISIAMMFISGVNMLYLVPFFIFSIPIFYFLILKVPYRLRRIIGYLDPWGDMKGAGFQIVQSFLALGSGGILGIGLGSSRQKLFYLPQAHTDFIFSIIGEELGFIGTLTVLFLFAIFIWLGVRISLKAKDLFANFLALGITLSIGGQALINIAVSTGAIPTKGLPLPFISYGGTALVFNMASVAILLNIAKRT